MREKNIIEVCKQLQRFDSKLELLSMVVTRPQSFLVLNVT